MIDCHQKFVPLLLFGIIIVNFVGTSRPRTWDVAVTIGQEIHFLSRNGSLIERNIIKDGSSFVSASYDDHNQIMFLSDANFSILSIDFLEDRPSVKTLLQRNSHILGLVYDHVSKCLFWAEDNAIIKMPISQTHKPEPVILHNLQYEQPRGISLDTCNRHLFWVNSNRSHPSIQRSNLDGSNKVTIIENLYYPTTIAIDQRAQKLYWVDDTEGIHYKLERSNLNGAAREELVHGKHQQPGSLAVDEDNVYWSDYVYRAVWYISKKFKPGKPPKILRSYEENKELDPTSVISKYNVGDNIDCQAVKSGKYETPNLPSSHSDVELSNNSISSSEVLNFKVTSVQFCSNNGIYDGDRDTCHCPKGFTGLHCDVSSCHNYCVTGECFLNDRGYPTCRCNSSHTGSRCEYNLCKDYCLNNGACFVEDGQPFCECKHATGSRCEINVDPDKLCSLFCMSTQLNLNSLDASFCSCAQFNNTLEALSYGYEDFKCTILIPLLSGVVGTLLIVIIILSIYINKLRRRPRIKKRFVVSKNGITPLTSRSPFPNDQCEITIENCCNMNICETPCFEPKLRNPPENRKKEEKNNLLDNMEGDLL